MKKNDSSIQDQDQPISQNQILQMLHRKKMILIEQKFRQKQKGLLIDQFISVMLEYLEYDNKNEKLKKQLTQALVDFFKEVDVNGDQTMEWQQFSNHIIQLGLLRDDRSFKNVIKSYFQSDKIIDRQKHQVGIENVYYFQKLKNLFLIQKQSSRFKVYGVNNANLQYQVNAHKGNILDMQFLQQQNLIASSSNDLTINFWDATSFTLKQIVSVPQIQLKIRYANWKESHKQLLYTGGSDAIIHIYDAATLKQRGTISGWNPFYKSDQQQEGHCSPIGDILPINQQQTLVTACLGGNICLWDVNKHQLKKQLRGHDKGIYSLDWCNWSPMNQCLLSAGLDHEAYVWNTYVKDSIYVLRGHNHPLVGVKCLPDSPQIITADLSGMTKVWDVRNFLCVQTFNVPVDELTSFCLTYPKGTNQQMKKRIICGGKKLHYFQYDEPKDQFLTDQKYCIKVIYNSTLLCFITMHSDSIKVWQAQTGKLISVYRGLSGGNAELTSMILDQRQRKLFVGDSQGCIYTVNIKNGAKMKQFSKHQSTVTGLACWSSDDANLSDERYSDMRRIISISQNIEVNIHDQDAPQDAKSTCRYIMKQHQKGCNSVTIRKGTQMLASGSDDGCTIMTNLISYRHQVLPNRSINQIKHVLFLDPYDCLVNVDSQGLITFYGVGQNKLKNKMLFQYQYMTESLTNQIEAFPITSINFYSDQDILILGDQFGNIQCWNIQSAFALLAKSKIQRTSFLFTNKRQSKTSRKSQFQQNALITQIGQKQSFSEQMMKLHMKMKQAHNDGITSIQIIKQNQAFITSSFDCCCHIWKISNGHKIGSLLLGGDVNWKLQFDLTARKIQAQEQANQILERIQKKKNLLYCLQNGTQQQMKEYQIMKQGVLKGARNLIQHHKKTATQDPFINIMSDTNRLEKQFFQQQDDQNSFNLISEVSQIKNNDKKKKNNKY